MMLTSLAKLVHLDGFDGYRNWVAGAVKIASSAVTGGVVNPDDPAATGL